MGPKTREPKPDKTLIKAETALVETGLAQDLEHARSLISCGLVFVGDSKVGAGTRVSQELLSSGKLRVKYKKPYVSRGASKLASVFNRSHIDVNGFACMDIGASTGGFTQLLLEKGASVVYAVDVGRGILDQKIRMDSRVVVLEGVNARFMGEYEEIRNSISSGSIDLCVMDLSFISVKQVIPALVGYIKKGGYLIPMIKPQFEAAREKVEKGGVVRDGVEVARILQDVSSFLDSMGFELIELIPSDIKGPSGNLEYFCVTKKNL